MYILFTGVGSYFTVHLLSDMSLIFVALIRAVRAGQCAVAVRRIGLLEPITAEFVSAALGEWTITAHGESLIILHLPVLSN